jgi:hypothetical protein
MIEYFVNSTIIVRSSILLEDSFGNAFAGKYESIFCVNQGDPQQRYNEFETAVRRIYASTMDEDALYYRFKEASTSRMSNGTSCPACISHIKPLFLSDIVSEHLIMPMSEKHSTPRLMLRLFLGLAQGRGGVEDDYPQIIASTSRCFTLFDKRCPKFSQRRLTVDIEQNRFVTIDVNELLKKNLDIKPTS